MYTAEKEKQFEGIPHNAEQRLYDDTTTWLAEAVEGSMRSEFTYQFDGRELYARDGSALSEIFSKAIDKADKLPVNLAFEARRRRHEWREYEDMIAMAKGELPNTMLVISDFPEELIQEQKDVGGYNVTRKQTMMRVIRRNEQGEITVVSQSLEGSERESLEHLYNFLGVESPEEGELLGQRRHVHIDDPAHQELLADSLLREYDQSLQAKTGIRHYAGIQNAKPINTYNFVCEQTDLLSVYFGSSRTINDNEQLLGSIAAAISERYYKAMQGETVPVKQTNCRMQLPASVFNEIHQAATRAASQGKVFSGCGGSIEVLATDELSELGYGNRSDEKTTYSFNKKQHCVVCQPQPKDHEPKKMCGPCGICRTCDAKL